MRVLAALKNTLDRCSCRSLKKGCKSSKLMALFFGAMFGLLRSYNTIPSSHPPKSLSLHNTSQLQAAPAPALSVEERLWQNARRNRLAKFDHLKDYVMAQSLSNKRSVLNHNQTETEKLKLKELLDKMRKQTVEELNNNPGGPADNAKHRNSDGDVKQAVEENALLQTNRSMYLKEDKVVNPHPFKVLLSNPDLCKVENLFIITYVHTAVDHYKRRAIIRQTWGNIKRFPNMRILFVMGYTSNILTMQNALEFESKTYKDILQEDFEDTYKNLTYKGIAALKWISENCQNAKYVLKTDDDVFVNMYTMLNHFQLLTMSGYKSELILCMVWWKMHALRDGKWGIPVEMYPESLYPVYCSGMAYMFSIDVADKLYQAAPYVRFFWVDDVYISGMLPRAQGLNHTNMGKAYIGANVMEFFFTHDTEWHKYAFSHIGNEDTFLRVWDQMTALSENFVIPPPKKFAPGVLADKYEPREKVLPQDVLKKLDQNKINRAKAKPNPKPAKISPDEREMEKQKRAEEFLRKMRERKN